MASLSFTLSLSLASRRGFTLIELMIVLAIIAITAAYAVPAYQNYIARGRVGEGLSLAAMARMAVAENAAVGQPLNAGFQAPPATSNVASIGIAVETGEIRIAYTTRVAAATANSLVLVPSTTNAANERVSLVPGTPPTGSIVWECFAAGKAASADGGPGPSAAATLPSALAAASCR